MDSFFNYLEILPVELYEEIFLKLNYYELIQFSLTNKYAYNICNNKFWYHYLLTLYPKLLSKFYKSLSNEFSNFLGKEIVRWIFERKVITMRYSNPHCTNIYKENITIYKYTRIKDIILLIERDTKIIRLLNTRIQVYLDNEDNIVLKFISGPKIILNNNILMGEIITFLDYSIFDLIEEINIHHI